MVHGLECVGLVDLCPLSPAPHLQEPVLHSGLHVVSVAQPRVPQTSSLLS